MNGSYLLDTNIVILLLNGDAAIRQHIQQATGVYLPSVVVGELYFGAYNSGQVASNLNRIGSFVASNVVLACDAVTAREYGQLKKALRDKGRPIPDNDVWIAAVAQQYALTLATRDMHFGEIDSLTWEAW